MIKRMPWLVPVLVVVVVATGVWWFVFRENKDEKSNRLIAAAGAAMKAGNLASAEENLKKALALRPNNGVLLHNLGVLYVNQKRLPEARVAFQRAADSDGPQANQVRAEELLQLAQISYAEKNWQRTVSELQQAIAADPQRTMLYTRLLDLQLGRMNDHAGADSTVARFLRACGPTARNYEDVAFVYYQDKEYALCGQLAQRATALVDTAYSAYSLAARAMWRQGQVPQGLAYIDAALRRHPTVVSLLVTKGLLLLEGSHRDAALAVSDQALRLSPRDYSVHQLRQKVFANFVRLDKALEEVGIARELTQDPDELRILLRQQRTLEGLMAAAQQGAGAGPRAPVADSTGALP
jgi:tetratricopeptide (TPR) repeat protein